MKKIERITGIIYALKENKKMTAKELAQFFEVSERTIYRDIDALAQLKVPIISLEGYEGGYMISDNYFVPSLRLVDEEVLLLLLCMKAGEAIKVPNMSKASETLKHKLLNTLEEGTKDKYQRFLEDIYIHMKQIIPERYCDGMFTCLMHGFMDRKDLILNYYSPKKGTHHERRITPYGLTFSNGGWFLYGYCYLSEGHRCFRLDRIKGIELSHISHTKEQVEAYILEKQASNMNYKIRMDMDKRLYEVMKNDLIFMNAITEDKGDRVGIELKAQHYIEYMLIGLENVDQVTIYEPQVCIDEMIRVCDATLSKYKQ